MLDVSGFEFQTPNEERNSTDMAVFQKFEAIKAWQKSRELTRQIYDVSNRDKFFKDFGLRDQIRRAGISVMSNIAEGYERSGTGEFVQFLAMAKGSVGEVVSHLYVAKDQGYLAKEDFEQIITLSKRTARIISGLMSYLRTSGIK